MDENLRERLERARELLGTVRHAAIATVNEDGTPHNTPVLFFYDEILEHLYWGSSPQAQHSKNIVRTGEIFVALYEANTGGGLFIKASQARVAEGKELAKAVLTCNKLRVKRGQPQLNETHYSGSAPQRLYIANTEAFWVNISERDTDGNVMNDYRHKVPKQELL